MSLSLATITVDGQVAKSLTERADRIRYWLGRGRVSFEDYVCAAYQLGAELLAAKEEVEHGNAKANGAGFERWVKDNVPEIARGSVWKAMEFTKRLQVKFPADGKSLPCSDFNDGEFPSEAKALVLNAVHEFGDVRTMTDLQRAMGLIRPPKPPEHHPRKPAGAAEKLLSDEKAAEASCADLLLTLDVMHQWVPFISDAQREQLLDAFVDRSNLLRAAKRAASARHKAKAKG